MNKEFHNLFPQGSPNTVAGQYFSGASYLCPLSDMGVSVSNVTFEPSCRYSDFRSRFQSRVAGAGR